MAWKQVLEVFDLLDDARVTGQGVGDFLQQQGVDNVSISHVNGERGDTDFVKAMIPGADGRLMGGTAPTIGIIGRLGGIGARPNRTGIVSDADGALVTLSVAAKLGTMRQRGDVLAGDVIVATHICPHAHILPHEPVPFMISPVDMAVMNRHEVDDRMQAILSVDASRGNRIVNHKGIAITPTIKQGYILRVSEDLLQIVQDVTGRPPVVLPITMQDITPYGNGVFHINSILQPATATPAPVVGVATTTETAVPGSATGATQLDDVERATRFCIEVAKAYGAEQCAFFDAAEFARLQQLYGEMTRFQTLGHGERDSDEA